MMLTLIGLGKKSQAQFLADDLYMMKYIFNAF